MNEQRTTTMNRWRGLVHLARTVVDQGSRAIERVQTEEVARAVTVVGGVIPQLRGPARAVGALHDLVAASTHARIRQVAQIVEAVVVAAIDARADTDTTGSGHDAPRPSDPDHA